MQRSDFDDRLIKALTLYADELLLDIPSDDVLRETQTFSQKFERKMRKLIVKASFTKQQWTREIAKRIAMILLTVAIGSSCLLSVEAIRTPVLRFFADIQETFTRITFQSEVETDTWPEVLEKFYVPGFIPEGFLLDYQDDTIQFSILNYRLGNDDFEWSQYTVYAVINVDTEGATTEELIQNGVKYFYYENKGRKHLIWQQYGYAFMCDGTISKELLLQIAESIKEK